ncbi:MAG: hypothetical protein N3G21_09050 [Candidatus Hydrogenedentes bacterium]|nr:hypothetical protein [Candidatus Hydrogenedentota bacterium]
MWNRREREIEKNLLVPIFILIGLILPTLIQAQEANLGKYTSMKIERVGKLKGSFQGGMNIKEMTDGVSIVLLSDDTKTPPMPVKADRMFFEWEEGRKTPAKIIMEGKVYLEHPEGKLSAEKAVWDFVQERVEFTGNPVLDSPKAQGLKGSKIVLDFKNNTVDIENLRADMIPLQGSDFISGEDQEIASYLLSEKDIVDWNEFINELKRQAQSNTDTPGKYLLSKFDSDARQQFISAPNELILQRKKDLLKQINTLLKKPDFYRETAWHNVQIPQEAKDLLSKPELTSGERIKLNRILLYSAFPKYIKPI